MRVLRADLRGGASDGCREHRRAGGDRRRRRGSSANDSRVAGRPGAGDHPAAGVDVMTASRIGDSPARVGGIGRVTGAQQYVADLSPGDVLHARLVTVDAPRARILGIDATAALALPGVRLVLSSADLPQPVPRFGPQNRDRPVLAVGETKYHGDPVAIVVADTVDQAEAGAAGLRAAPEPPPPGVPLRPAP